MLRLICSLLCCGVICAAPTPQASVVDPSSKLGKDANYSLGDLLQAEDASASGDGLPRRIAALGEGTPGWIFEALSSGQVATRDGASIAVSERLGEELVRAAILLGREPVMAYLETRCGDLITQEQHVVLLELAGRVGDKRDLKLVLACAEKLDPSFGLGTSESLPMRTAVTRILERDEQAYPALGVIFDRSQPGLQSSLTYVVGGLDAPERGAWLCDRIGRGSEVEFALLSELARPTRRPIHTKSQRALEAIDSYLTGEDIQVLREAIRAAGRLQYFGALDALIALLEHEQAVVRDEAYRALVSISGLRLSASAERWKAWLAPEKEWFESSFEETSDSLNDADHMIVAEALRELSRHRFKRHQSALRAAALLESNQVETISLALDALSLLGSNIVCAQVIPLLSNPNPRIANQALVTLRSVTGIDLGLDAQAWESATRG